MTCLQCVLTLYNIVYNLLLVFVVLVILIKKLTQEIIGHKFVLFINPLRRERERERIYIYNI